MPPLLDLTGISGAGQVGTLVFLDDVAWIRFGRCDLRRNRPNRGWILTGYVDNAMDRCHEWAIALALPLVGVKLREIENSTTCLAAWIPNQEFRVPEPGYDPRIHPGTVRCTDPHSEVALRGHVIVPDEVFEPPHNQALLDQVVGQQVRIYI